jgi:hypothetical protein
MVSDAKPTPSSGQYSLARPCLLVIFRPQLTLARGLRWPLDGFRIGDKRYRQADFGDWTGFYDWLRDSETNLLGVRYWPFKQTEFLIDHLQGRSYVKADPSRHVEIYFSEGRGVNAKLSCDQEFLYDAVFRADDGEYAIGFGVEELGRSEMHSLEEAVAQWVVADPP